MSTFTLFFIFISCRKFPKRSIFLRAEILFDANSLSEPPSGSRAALAPSISDYEGEKRRQVSCSPWGGCDNMVWESEDNEQRVGHTGKYG